MTHSNAAYSEAIALVDRGVNDCEIARTTGIARSTVRDWRRGPRVMRRIGPQHACATCGHPEHDFQGLPWPSYAYLLGMYLGDGSIDRLARTWRLDRSRRSVARAGGKSYAYPRYNFTNASEDIRTLFTSTCDLLGIEWRQMNARNISVARRASVATLDRFVGPKR